jgi:transposase-like protein
MAKKRRYSDEGRAAALAALAANAGNVARTAKQLGIPARTLESWAKGERHPEAAQMCDEKKGPMADALQQAARKIVDSLAGKIERASLKDAAIAFGVLIDKMRLLRDQPTDIVKSDADLTLTGRIAAYEAAYAGAAAREGAVPVGEGDQEG